MLLAFGAGILGVQQHGYGHDPRTYAGFPPASLYGQGQHMEVRASTGKPTLQDGGGCRARDSRRNMTSMDFDEHEAGLVYHFILFSATCVSTVSSQTQLLLATWKLRLAECCSV